MVQYRKVESGEGSRTNVELSDMNDENIINCIKAQTVSWVGYIVMMDHFKQTRRLFQ